MTDENRPLDAVPPAKERDISPGMIVAAIVLILALVLTFQNTARSDVKFLWLELEAPTWAWFLILFLVGTATGWFAHMVRVAHDLGIRVKGFFTLMSSGGFNTSNGLVEYAMHETLAKPSK